MRWAALGRPSVLAGTRRPQRSSREQERQGGVGLHRDVAVNALQFVNVKQPAREHERANQHHEGAGGARESLRAGNEAFIELYGIVRHRRRYT